LASLATDQLIIPPRSKSSDRLQQYLLDSTRRISGLAKKADAIGESDLADVARAAVESTQPSQRFEIEAALKTLDIRKNVFRKLDGFLRASVVNVHMGEGDINTGGSGPAGAIGRANTVQGNTFNQIVSSVDEIALRALLTELPLLRAEMKKRAADPEQDMAVGAIAEAEKAAHASNSSGIVQALARAGRWTLTVAKEIAVPVATKLLQSSLGLPSV
jgi:hypothetical protein